MDIFVCKRNNTLIVDLTRAVLVAMKKLRLDLYVVVNIQSKMLDRLVLILTQCPYQWLHATAVSYD